MRRLAILIVGLATLSALACRDSATDPGGPLTLALSLNATAGGSDAAFDKADQIAVRLLDGSAIVFEQSYDFSSAGGDVTIDAAIDRSLAGRLLTLDVFLRWQGAVLFQGTGAVTPRAGGAESVDITLIPVPVSILVEEPPTLTELGATLQLHAEALFATGDTARDVAVTWSLLDQGVITLTSGGVATATAEGTARVEAHAGQLTALATVEVHRAVASVRLSASQLSLRIGGATPVEAFVLASNGDELPGREVTWTSNDPTVADVAPQDPGIGTASAGSVAVITGRSLGSTTIHAVAEGVEATVAVAVINPPVALVPVTPLRANIVVGGTATFTAMPTDDAGDPLPGRSVTWTSSDPSVATVSGSGTTVTVTGKAPGVTTVIATSEGRTGLVTVAVAATGPVPLAWARAHQPGSTSEYAPEGMNLAGGGMAVGTEVDGLYFLTFDRLGLGALGSHFSVFVTAEASGPIAGLSRPETSCYVYDVYAAQPFGLGVECVDAASRSLVAVPFTAVVVGDGVFGGAGAPTQRSYFSLHNNPQSTGKPYTPLADFSWNSAGAPMTVFPTTSGVTHQPGVTMRPPFATFVARLGQPGAEDCAIQSVAATEVNVGCWGLSGGVQDLYHFVMGIEKGRPGTQWGLIDVDPVCPMAGPGSTNEELDALDPAAATMLKSVASSTPAQIEFRNDACERVQLYWIDYDGLPQNYGTLAPGQSLLLGTYVTHPWFVVGQSSGALAVFQPKPGLAVARIRPMSSSTGPVEVMRIGAGKYRVVFDGSSGTGPPAVLVSPRAAAYAACTQRVTAFAPVTVEVGCWGPSGQFQDTRFSLAYLR